MTVAKDGNDTMLAGYWQFRVVVSLSYLFLWF
ncbi:Uncharacterised protein [Serratia fonticola]|nr:Uncharacterised protein [Serratia fonticola]